MHTDSEHAPSDHLLEHGGGELAQVDRPYLLVVNLPHFVDEDGSIHLDRLWHHDLVQHLAYLPKLVVASPRLPLSSAQEELVRFEGPASHFIALPARSTGHPSLSSLHTTAWRLFQAVGEADIVHSSVAGWPYPLGWLATASARLRRKNLLVVVESAPWRAFDGTKRGVRSSLRGALYEKLAAWSCRHADVALFTQPTYRDTLHRRAKGTAYITPATWIRSKDVICAHRARAHWQDKAERPLRVLFAGRLTAAKGVEVVREAIERLDREGTEIAVDFIGEGELAESIRGIGTLTSVNVRLLDPVAYGNPFFELLEDYHAVLVPSLSDEQPRILFDAAARAVPVIASDTDGIRPHVHDGITGHLLRPGDVETLADTLKAYAADPSPLAAMGLSAHEKVKGATHEAMHATRARLLARHFSK